MPSDAEQIKTILSQTLALIAEVTQNPKPNYSIDGQSVSWASYLASLRSTVDWCEAKLAGLEPFEIESQGTTS